MDFKDKQEVMSKFESIFKNEKAYYGNKIPVYSGYFDYEAESFFKKIKANKLNNNPVC